MDQSQLVQIMAAMVTHHLLDNKLILQVKLLIQLVNLITLKDSSTKLLDKLITLLVNLIILIKATNNLSQATKLLQCKDNLYKVNLTINISNHHNIDKFQINTYNFSKLLNYFMKFIFY